MGTAVIAHGDATPVFEFSEHVVDGVALLVEGLAVAQLSFAVLTRRDAGSDAVALQRCPEPVGVITAVGDQLLRFGQTVEQASCARVIARLSCRQVQVDGPAAAIADRMKLRVQAALRATDTAGNSPFLSRLAAVRCALRCVAAIINRSGGPCAPASARNIRSNTPIRLQRMKRLYNVFGGPYARGASFHGRPFLTTSMIPLTTRRSSTRGTP